MNILVLGATGFIGSKLFTLLSKDNVVTQYKRHGSNSRKVTFTHFDLVINCAASRYHQHLEEAQKSNFDFPKYLYETISFTNWIQIESYYQLQIPHGRQDPYTVTKQKFHDFLCSQEKPNFRFLYLPHVFGEGDSQNRLITSAIKSFSRGGQVTLANPYQTLPIAYIQDVINSIKLFTSGENQIASCLPFYYEETQSIVEFIRDSIGMGTILFNQKEDVEAQTFPRVSFPNPINCPFSTMNISQFAGWIQEKSLEYRGKN
jgi:nucleoside-diphosphate-sugar epimerase